MVPLRFSIERETCYTWISWDSTRSAITATNAASERTVWVYIKVTSVSFYSVAVKCGIVIS